EYYFEKYNDRTNHLEINKDIDFKGIESGKWIGLQFIRQVDTENKRSKQIVRINKNPMDDSGILRNPNNFEDYIIYRDEQKEGDEHIPHVWSGINDIISVVGAEFVSLYGISMYEVEFDPSSF